MRKGILTELTTRYKLVGMATERKEVVKYLEQSRGELIRHILKRALTDSSKSPDHSHWDDEINGMLNILSDITLKHNKKRISFSMMKQYVLQPQFEDADDLEVQVDTLLTRKRLTKNLLIPYDPEKAHKSINTLLEIIFKEIEKNKYNIDDWRNKYSPLVDNLEIV